MSLVGTVEAHGPPKLVVRIRDKFMPQLRLSVSTPFGRLPYDHGDLVAAKLITQEFEPDEIAILLRILPLCRGFIDVGANLGLYSLLAARLSSTAGPVYAFEASRIEFSKLSWTIAKNGLGNVAPVLAAVSDSVGEATIYESLYGAGALNRLDGPAKPTGQWRATTVPMITLDSWFADRKTGPIDLIKIDVEGHELPVLMGAVDLIEEHRPAVLIEMNPGRASERSNPELVWSFLADHGYRWLSMRVGTTHLEESPECPRGTVNAFAIARDARNQELVERLLRRPS